jgi:EF hand
MMGQGMMQPAQPGTPPAEAGMKRPGMMGHGMMGGMPMMGPRGHMMKVMFAIADTNGDGALSFEEVTAVHKRIFERVDANKDGKVSPEEIQIFMRE